VLKDWRAGGPGPEPSATDTCNTSRWNRWVHSRRNRSVILGGRWGTSADVVEVWTAQHEQDIGAQMPPDVRRGRFSRPEFAPAPGKNWPYEDR
jgi:hypothetical protein